MKKGLLIAALLLGGSISLMAAKVGETVVGLEFGASKINATTTVNGVTYDGGGSTTHETLSIGKYYNFGRVSAYGQIMNKNDGKAVGLSYDYMFYNDSAFVPFIGISAGYNWTTAEGAGLAVDTTNFTYGVQAGVVYELSKTVDLEGGVRYIKTSEDDSGTVPANYILVPTENIVQYYLSLGYKF